MGKYEEIPLGDPQETQAALLGRHVNGGQLDLVSYEVEGLHDELEKYRTLLLRGRSFFMTALDDWDKPGRNYTFFTESRLDEMKQLKQAIADTLEG